MKRGYAAIPRQALEFDELNLWEDCSNNTPSQAKLAAGYLFLSTTLCLALRNNYVIILSYLILEKELK